MDDDEDSAVAFEVELLRGMYPEDMLDIIPENPDSHHVTCLLHLVPHTGGDGNLFVKCTLALVLNVAAYPDEPPTISLTRSRGLNEQQQKELIVLLECECVELAGDYVCSTLAQLASDYLTEHNRPPRCSICLEEICVSIKNKEKKENSIITTNECFHIFHAACLTSWWERCAMSAATGYRSVSVNDLKVERLSYQQLVTGCSAHTMELTKHEKLLPKLLRRQTCYMDQRKKMDRPGTLSSHEKEQIEAMDLQVSSVCNEIDSIKISQKNSRSMLKKLKWKMKETEERVVKLEAGVKSMATLDFKFQCPVCRTVVDRKLLDPFLKFDQCDGGASSGGGGRKKGAEVEEEEEEEEEESLSSQKSRVPAEFRDYVETIQKYHQSLRSGLSSSSSSSSSSGKGGGDSGVDSGVMVSSKEVVVLEENVGGSKKENPRQLSEGMHNKKHRKRRQKKKR